MAAARRVAIVTGAASGIGKAIVLKLASDGFDVALNDLPSSLEQLDEVATLASQSGGNTILIPGDVSSDVDVERMVDDTVKRLGGLDAVCTSLLLIWLRPTITDADGSQRRHSRSTGLNNRTFVPCLIRHLPCSIQLMSSDHGTMGPNVRRSCSRRFFVLQVCRSTDDQTRTWRADRWRMLTFGIEG